MRSTTTGDNRDELLRKARLYESMVNAGTPPELATIFVDASQPMPELTDLQKFGKGLARVPGLAGRAAQRALGGYASQVVGAGLMNSGLGIPSLEQAKQGAGNVNAAFERAGTAMGLPTPNGATERYGVSGMAGLAGGIPFGPSGMLGGLTSGLAVQGAQDANLDEAGQTIAGLLGSIPGALGGHMIEMRRNPQAQAASVVNKAYKAEGTSAQQGLTDAGQQAAGRPDLTLRETGGDPLQSVALRVAKERGTGGRAMVRGAVQRLSEIRTQMLEQARTRLGGSAGVSREVAFEKTLKPQVDAAYDAIRYQPVEVTPAMQNLLDNPNVLAAARRAVDNFNQMAAAEGKPQIPYLLDAEGNFRQTVPLAVLDEIQKGFADVAKSVVDPVARKADMARAEATSRSITSLVDEQVNGYDVARALHADLMGKNEAIQFGRNLVRSPAPRKGMRGAVDNLRPVNAEEVATQWAKFSPDQRVLAKQGIVDGLASLKGQPVAALENVIQKAQAIFSPDELSALQQVVDEAKGLTQSATAVRNAGRPTAAPKSRGLIGRLITDVVVGMRRTLARDAQQIGSEGAVIPPAARDVLATMLNSRGPQAQITAEQLMALIQDQQNPLMRATVGAGLATQQQR